MPLNIWSFSFVEILFKKLNIHRKENQNNWIKLKLLWPRMFVQDCSIQHSGLYDLKSRILIRVAAGSLHRPAHKINWLLRDKVAFTANFAIHGVINTGLVGNCMTVLEVYGNCFTPSMGRVHCSMGKVPWHGKHAHNTGKENCWLKQTA